MLKVTDISLYSLISYSFVTHFQLINLCGDMKQNPGPKPHSYLPKKLIILFIFVKISFCP